MEKIVLAYFPFPYVIDHERQVGYRFSWARQCDHCSRACETAAKDTLDVCGNGVNYLRLSPKIVSFGFIVATSNPSSATKKAIHQNPDRIIKAAELDTVVGIFQRVIRGFSDDIEARKRSVVEKYKQDRGYEQDFLKLLRPEIQKAFSFLHDYKQFIARIRQNINVVLASRYSGVVVDDMLARALPSEKAIYWATVLMEEKLETAVLLLHPERIKSEEGTLSRLHGLVTKYVHIYQAAFSEKNVTVKTEGFSVGEVKGPRAISIIPHTLIDNALKYSPRDSQVLGRYGETDHDITLSVSSYGPRIKESERDKIFDIFFRADAAVRQEEEGTGVGLYLAQFVAHQFGTTITVKQDPQNTPSRGHWTTFSVCFKRHQ
ncbi:MAG: HAMP domain-containing sensor histidine kinase [Candidatus Korobacteraceae bacterium]